MPYNAVLCGNNGEACWAKYGAYPLHRPFCHEMALRILLASIESHANRYKRHIVPVLSLSIDFYIRVWLSADAPPFEHLRRCLVAIVPAALKMNCAFDPVLLRTADSRLPGGAAAQQRAGPFDRHLLVFEWF